MDKVQRLLKSNNWEENGKKALPMPIITKKRILMAQKDAYDTYSDYKEYNDITSLQDLKRSILRFYNLVWVYIEDLPRHKKSKYSELSEIRTSSIPIQNQEKEAKKWENFLYKLHKLLKDLGIVDIGIRVENSDFAYSVFEGTPFHGFERNNYRKEASNWINWYKLLAAIKTRAIKLKEDTDAFVFIWGDNRTGKDTLSLQLTQEVNPEPLTEKNIVFDDDDFYTATEDLNKYHAFHITEMSSLFYSKNAVKKKQKRRKLKLKTYAKKNMLMFGCDLNFYNLDKELISDKVSVAINVPKRGYFEYYNKKKIKEFKKDKNTGEPITPSPVFKGKFPKLEGRVWETYKEMEDEKVTGKQEEEEEEEKKVSEDLKHECSQCGHKWVGRKKNPAKCPKCQTPKWDQ